MSDEVVVMIKLNNKEVIMKKTGLLCICIILLFIMAIPKPSYSADIDDMDGNAWRVNSYIWKQGYVAGFFAGSSYVVSDNLYPTAKDYDIDNTNKLDEVGILLEDQKAQKNKQLTRYIFLVGTVTNTQVTEGLDKVYEDFKNRSIKLRDAVYLVKKQIEGTPQEDIERILLFLRGGKRDYFKHLFIKDEKGKLIRYILFP